MSLHLPWRQTAIPSVAVVCTLLTSRFGLAQTGTPTNLALKRPYTLSVPPNYGLSNDAGDAVQLTDGLDGSNPANLVEREGTRAIWVQPGTVGWQFKSPVIVTIDLGEVQPIGGIALSTAAGAADVHWPTAAHIAVSDDGQTWHYSGDLIALANKAGAPDESSYQTHIFRTQELATRGRYVAVAVEGKPYIFLDEIEVYKGSDANLQRPAPGERIESLQAWTTGNLIREAEKKRLQLDAANVRARIDAAKIAPDRKNALKARLDGLTKQLDELPLPDAATFRTTFPQNALQAQIWAVNGELLGATLPPLVISKTHRFAYETPGAAPARTKMSPALTAELMRNEKRSDSFLLTNATGKPTTAQLKLSGAIAHLPASWLTVNEVAWTDTRHHVPVADALLALPPHNGTYEVTLPAGLTRKVWFTVDSSKLQPGLHRGTVEVTANGKRQTVPFSIRVSPLQMSRPRLGLSLWDYTEGGGLYGITAKNRLAAMKIMKSGYVDGPWATRSVLPWPEAGAFDAAGNLKAPLSLARFDAWVKEWPRARHFFVFPNVQREFAGAALDTPEFKARVASWAKAVEAHCREIGLPPERLAILLVDEPETEEEDERIVAWARVIKAAAPRLTLFQDPVWHRPDQTKQQEAITLADIVCPDLTLYTRGGAPVAEYFRRRQAAGQDLWLYQCSGPTRTYSPSRYYREQCWQAFHLGAKGVGFWSMADLGSAPSSWNEYLGAWNAYVPVFLGETDATDSIHWQALNEGMQDNEYFSLLRDAATRTKNATLRAEAEALLKALPLAKIPTESKEGTYAAYAWSNPENPAAYDTYRLKVLHLLERLNRP